jgi:hypothetical protein
MATNRDDQGRFKSSPIKDHTARKLGSIPVQGPDVEADIEARRQGRNTPRYPGSRTGEAARPPRVKSGGEVGR